MRRQGVAYTSRRPLAVRAVRGGRRAGVRALAPSQLLAMKLSAWRDDLDIEDARLLLSKIEGDRERTWEQVEPYLVPGRELKSQYAFEDLWESEHADPNTD